MRKTGQIAAVSDIAASNVVPIRRPMVVEARDAIMALQAQLLALPSDDQHQFEYVHRFVPGIYARSVLLPANTVCTSYVHRVDNFFEVVMGHLLIFDTTGVRHDVAAPFSSITVAGTKRAVYAFEDSIVTTFHPNPTDERDIERIEALIFSREFMEEPQ